MDMKKEVARLATEYIFEQGMDYAEAVHKAAEVLEYKKHTRGKVNELDGTGSTGLSQETRQGTRGHRKV